MPRLLGTEVRNHHPKTSCKLIRLINSSNKLNPTTLMPMPRIRKSSTHPTTNSKNVKPRINDVEIRNINNIQGKPTRKIRGR